MSRSLVIFLDCVFFVILFTNVNASTITIQPKKPYGIIGEKLEIRANTDQQPFQTCSFVRTGIKIDKNNQTSELLYWENEEKSSCKLIIVSMKTDWKGPWVATIVDKDGIQNSTFSVGSIDPVQVVVNVTETLEVGSKLDRPCVYGQTFARVFNPQGVLVSEGTNAQISLPFVRVQDAGVWLCEVQMTDRLSVTEIYITVNVTSTTSVYTSVEETSSQVNLLCRRLDSSINIPCLFQSPTGITFAPREGVPLDRYEYFGNMTNNDCGLSIQKPLKESDQGIWKCLITSPTHASILKVGDKEIPMKSSTRMADVVVISSDNFQSNLTIQCDYTEPLTYCYARSPSGRIFSAITGGNVQEAAYTGMGLRQGDCEISIDGNHLWRNESGTWLCGMGVEGFDDVQVEINVLISGNHFRAEVNNHAVNTGEKVKLMCRSVMGYGLRYCRFNHPTGKSLNLGYHSSSLKDRFSYMGKGLDAGDCGLLIENVNTEDFGTWTCATAFVGKNWLTEFQDSIHLSPAPLGLGSILGISVTLGVLGIVGASGLVFWQLRRRNRGPALLQSVVMHNHEQDLSEDSVSDHSNSHNS